MGRRADGLTSPSLRLRDPSDVLAAIPFLLGYHPAESMVVLGINRRRYAFAARIDLPELHTPPDEVRTQVAYLLRVMQRQQVDNVLLVGYGPDDRVRALTKELGPAYLRLGFGVLEILRAENNRYWSYLCPNAICCPPEGSPYDPTSSGVAAECTLAGRVAFPDRAAFESQIRPVDGAARIAMREAATRADERLFAMLTHPPDEGGVERAILAAGHEAIARALEQHRAGQRLTDDEVAWLVLLMTTIEVRDAAWAQITGELSEMDFHRTLWMDIMRRCQPDLLPAPGSLFAFAAWRCGEGTIARVALERVLDLDPTYYLATLLYNAIVNGLPPSAVRDFPDIRRRSARRPRRRSGSRRAENRPA